MKTVHQSQLRTLFVERLSMMCAHNVPDYRALADVVCDVNEEVFQDLGYQAGRLGSVERVSVERHGAVRVGSPEELRDIARIFAALGMHPVGYYDLRDASTSSIPLVSTAFRPTKPDELEHNPFRVFTSILTVADRRFFSRNLQDQLESFFLERRPFPPELLALADRAERNQELPVEDADRFLRLAVHALQLTREPVDRAWYETLARISTVAADIGGLTSTHLNHLAPRVLDIDELYRRIIKRGAAIVGSIQGPPSWKGPDVLLRQTSFPARRERRTMLESDGTQFVGSLRVRFCEVEARGIALTPAGRALYDKVVAEVDDAVRARPAASRAQLAREIWEANFPATEQDLSEQRFAYFTYHVTNVQPTTTRPPSDLNDLLSQGWVRADPIVYEDFLQRSSAGVFESNLDGYGTMNTFEPAANYDEEWMAGVIDRRIWDPYELYEQQQADSITAAMNTLRIANEIVRPS